MPPFSGAVFSEIRHVDGGAGLRAPLVAGNWKMNGAKASIELLVDGIAGGEGFGGLTRVEVLVCPAFVYLSRVSELIVDTNIQLCAQDVDLRAGGAVTGGVSASMLKDIGCKYVIVGHSERRKLFDENDEVVATKFEQCLGHGLYPVLCVGESLAERQSGSTLDVVTRQLETVVNRVGAEAMASATVAYEPVWAIGTGESATPEQAEEVHRSLRSCLDSIDPELARSVRILYGGSVTPENASALFANENVDGALVGGASLEASSFLEICRFADQSAT